MPIAKKQKQCFFITFKHHIEKSSMFCPNCGKETSKTDKFCRQCGTILDSKPEAQAPREKEARHSVVYEIKPPLWTILSAAIFFLMSLLAMLLIPIIGFLIGIIGMGFSVYSAIATFTHSWTFYDDRLIATTTRGTQQVKYEDIDIIRLNRKAGVYSVITKDNRTIWLSNIKIKEIGPFLEEKTGKKAIE